MSALINIQLLPVELQRKIVDALDKSDMINVAKTYNRDLTPYAYRSAKKIHQVEKYEAGPYKVRISDGNLEISINNGGEYNKCTELRKFTLVDMAYYLNISVELGEDIELHVDDYERSMMEQLLSNPFIQAKYSPKELSKWDMDRLTYYFTFFSHPFFTKGVMCDIIKDTLTDINIIDN